MTKWQPWMRVNGACNKSHSFLFKVMHHLSHCQHPIHWVYFPVVVIIEGAPSVSWETADQAVLAALLYVYMLFTNELWWVSGKHIYDSETVKKLTPSFGKVSKKDNGAERAKNKILCIRFSRWWMAAEWQINYSNLYLGEVRGDFSLFYTMILIFPSGKKWGAWRLDTYWDMPAHTHTQTQTQTHTLHR